MDSPKNQTMNGVRSNSTLKADMDHSGEEFVLPKTL